MNSIKRRILYIGQIHDNSGYGVAARLNIRAIKKVIDQYSDTIELRCFSLSFELNSSLEKDGDLDQIKDLIIPNNEIFDWLSQGEYETVLHLPIPAAHLSIDWEHKPAWAKMQKIILGAKFNHNISAWESDSVPEKWVSMAEALKIQNFATPSEWNSKVFKESFQKQVSVVSHPIDTSPAISKKPFSFENKIKDLFKVVAISQWQPRKDFETLIRAFSAEFHDNEDVILIIKSYLNLMSADVSNDSKAIMNQIDAIKKSVFTSEDEIPKCKILFLGGVIPKDSVNRLISISDAYASCTRGEGFGLPISEAMCLSKPVIVPDQTGHMDFVTSDNFLIKGHWDMCHSIPGYPLDSNFYYPHINSTREQLRNCYEMFKNDKASFRKIGENNKLSCSREQFSLESVGHQFFEFINKKRS